MAEKPKLTRDNLHDYQRDAVATMTARPRGFAIIPLGGGKTVTTLTAASDLLDAGKIDRTWIIAPKRVASYVWPYEVRDWAHLHDLGVSLVVGTPKQREAALAVDADIYVCTFDLLPWLEKRIGHFPPNTFVALDEVTKISGPTSAWGKLLTKMLDQSESPRVWGLTGSPRSKDLLKLFGMVKVVMGTSMWGKSFYGWRKKHFYPEDYHGHDWQPKPGREEVLEQEFADVCFKVDSKQSEDPVYIDHHISIPARALKQHDIAITKKVLQVMADGVLRMSALVNAAVGSGKAKQIASGTVIDDEEVAHVVHRAKLDELEYIIDAADGPVLIGFQFRAELAMMRERWPDLPTLSGETSDAEAARLIAAWNRGELPMLAAHPLSMGHGLNLQAGGRRIAWFDLPSSLELYQQLNGRLARQGQTKQVYVHNIIARDTVDEITVARHMERDASQTRLINIIKKAQETINGTK